MTQFRVAIDFSTTVSEDAANELEILVAEFVQLILSVVANDEVDQIAATMANDTPIFVPDEQVGYLPPAEAFDLGDEGSDAQGYNGDGATDFDRR